MRRDKIEPKRVVATVVASNCASRSKKLSGNGLAPGQGRFEDGVAGMIYAQGSKWADPGGEHSNKHLKIA